MLGGVDDGEGMRLALDEAARGIGRTSPNPPVGAVVARGGEVLGRGWHRGAGCPHAEPEALADAVRRHGPGAVRGATVYVTLEPCSTHGRTPPCTSALIEAGVGRVVYGATDPNPPHRGRARELLERAGIEVVSGVLAAQCARLIRPFAKVLRSGLPWVIAKVAMSLDGRLTRPPGEGQWLTSPEARAEVHRLRARVDAIATSSATIRADDPALTVRPAALLDGREPPLRVVFSRHPAALPAGARLFTDPGRHRTRVVDGGDLEGSLRRLVQQEDVHCLLLEAGGTLTGRFLELGLIDEWLTFLAPLACGGPVAALAGPPPPAPPSMPAARGGIALHEVEFRQIGPDIMLRGIVAPCSDGP
jgi:diaminohydroxyphosphoribosylaminopyrimidine deaminase/5-amino-6-(5-phosphoribosylamino)uracil reductase